MKKLLPDEEEVKSYKMSLAEMEELFKKDMEQGTGNNIFVGALAIVGLVSVFAYAGNTCIKKGSYNEIDDEV